MGGACSEHEYFFPKSARRDVIDPFHMKMSFGSRPLEKKCQCIGGIKHSQNLWGGGGGTFPPPPPPLDTTLYMAVLDQVPL